jgi:hypothetical protein
MRTNCNSVMLNFLLCFPYECTGLLRKQLSGGDSLSGSPNNMLDLHSSSFSFPFSPSFFPIFFPIHGQVGTACLDTADCRSPVLSDNRYSLGSLVLLDFDLTNDQTAIITQKAHFGGTALYVAWQKKEKERKKKKKRKKK